MRHTESAMTAVTHPGFIELVDGETGRVLERRAAGELPESMRFEVDEHGASIPVVRIVEHVDGARRTLIAYGPKGELLRTTTQYAG